MIDMVFLLLIFFLLTSVFKSTAIETDLPSSSTAAYQNDQSIVISVKHSGDIYLNNTKTEKAALTELLIQNLKSGNQKDISIASDKSVPFENIISVMDIARNAGAESVSFITENAD